MKRRCLHPGKEAGATSQELPETRKSQQVGLTLRTPCEIGSQKDTGRERPARTIRTTTLSSPWGINTTLITVRCWFAHVLFPDTVIFQAASTRHVTGADASGYEVLAHEH